MSLTPPTMGVISDALGQTDRSVVELVDDLLRLCPAGGLRLEWQGVGCRVSTLSNGQGELVDGSALRKSAFRGLLARVAALCNEYRPDSVSPYGGTGEALFSQEPSRVLRVAFTNTPAEQWLELVPEGCDAPA